jgi:hypothetical protein
VYCIKALATKVLSKRRTSRPEGSDKEREGERSKIEFGEGRVDHWYDGEGRFGGVIF